MRKVYGNIIFVLGGLECLFPKVFGITMTNMFLALITLALAVMLVTEDESK